MTVVDLDIRYLACWFSGHFVSRSYVKVHGDWRTAGM